jgi:predicted permease
VFSIVNALLLRPLAVPAPHEVIAVSAVSSTSGATEPLSLATFEQIYQRQQIFSAMFAWRGDYPMATFEVDGVTYASTLAEVSGDYFETLRVRPHIGRLITREDVRLGRPAPAPVAVLGYRCWRERYNSNPGVLGRIVRVQGQPLTIVGVTREDFTGLVVEVTPEVTVPMGIFWAREVRDAETFPVSVVARLRPEVTPALATTNIQAIWPTVLADTVPDSYSQEERTRFLERHVRLEAVAMGISYTRERRSRPLAALMVLMCLVLFIATANIANLTFARAMDNRREIGIRLALGASRRRLVWQSICESLLLSAAAAVMALSFAGWAGRWLIDLTWTGYVPTTVDVGPDLRVLGFTVAITVLVAVLSGLLPARAALKLEYAGTLRDSPRALHGRGSPAKLLVVTQVALSVVLLTGAILLGRTLHNLRSGDLGFQRQGMLLVHLFPRPGSQSVVDRSSYYRNLAARLEQLPGVAAVSYSRMGPLARSEFEQRVSATSPAEPALECASDFVGPGFFRWTGIPIVAGREFDWRDNEDSARVAVVSDRLAERLFPQGGAVGRSVQVETPAGRKRMEVVGVVRSASLWTVRTHEPMALYIPLMQEPNSGHPMVGVRVRGKPSALLPEVRSVIESMGHHFPLRLETLEERTNAIFAEERMMGMLSAFLSGLGLLLSAIGVYGVTAYSVVRRTQEMGVRMSVGARPAQVLILMLRETAGLAAAGIAAGVAGALAVAGLLGAVLYEISSTDPLTICVAAAVLGGVTMISAYLPARRASRLDPMSALRCE